MSLHNICALLSRALSAAANNEICRIGRDLFNFNRSAKESNSIYVIKCAPFKEHNWLNEDTELAYHGCLVEVLTENKFGNIFMPQAVIHSRESKIYEIISVTSNSIIFASSRPNSWIFHAKIYLHLIGIPLNDSLRIINAYLAYPWKGKSFKMMVLIHLRC